jgi:3-oxoacid CoA-transferase subunit A
MVIEVIEDAKEAVSRVPSGSSIGVGGFGLSGSPVQLLEALCELGRRDLHLISNNMGGGTDAGMDRLAMEGRIRKFTGSFPGGASFFEGYYTGSIELEMVPQGTLAERLRSGGAGSGAFYTPASAATILGEGGFPAVYDANRTPLRLAEAKETRTFGGKPYVLEEAIRPDFGLVKAYVADRKGNLMFRLTARNFNPLVAMAADQVIVQVERFLENEEIEPSAVHLPGIFVDVVVPARIDVPSLPSRLRAEPGRRNG